MTLVMFSPLFACWFDCEQDYENTTIWISTKHGGRMGSGPGKSPLNYDVDLEKGQIQGFLKMTFINIIRWGGVFIHIYLFSVDNTTLSRKYRHLQEVGVQGYVVRVCKKYTFFLTVHLFKFYEWNTKVSTNHCGGTAVFTSEVFC